jgi:hypothetical protein
LHDRKKGNKKSPTTTTNTAYVGGLTTNGAFFGCRTTKRVSVGCPMMKRAFVDYIRGLCWQPIDGDASNRDQKFP